MQNGPSRLSDPRVSGNACWNVPSVSNARPRSVMTTRSTSPPPPRSRRAASAASSPPAVVAARLARGICLQSSDSRAPAEYDVIRVTAPASRNVARRVHSHAFASEETSSCARQRLAKGAAPVGAPAS